MPDDEDSLLKRQTACSVRRIGADTYRLLSTICVFFGFHAFFAPAGVHNQDGMKCCADLVETFMVNRFGCIMLVKMWHFVAFGNPKRTIS